jgi:hypothetical protein
MIFFLVLFPLVISAAYFFESPKGESFTRRVTTSAHGISITALYFPLLFGWPEHGAPKLVVLYDVLLFLSAALIFGALFLYRGPKGLHLLQLLNLLSLAWLWFTASLFEAMSVSGVSL